jgi:hypothetical protein
MRFTGSKGDPPALTRTESIILFSPLACGAVENWAFAVMEGGSLVAYGPTNRSVHKAYGLWLIKSGQGGI